MGCARNWHRNDLRATSFDDLAEFSRREPGFLITAGGLIGAGLHGTELAIVTLWRSQLCCCDQRQVAHWLVLGFEAGCGV